jgi:phage shock protein C
VPQVTAPMAKATMDEPNTSEEVRVGKDLSHPLRRSRDDRMVAGVCGGIAHWLGWDSTAVRVIYVLASLLSAAFPGIVAYVVLWFVMPEDGYR